jgi:hypothetical protein
MGVCHYLEYTTGKELFKGFIWTGVPKEHADVV